MPMRRVTVTDHAIHRYRQRVGKNISKKRLGSIVSRVLFSKSRLGIDNIENDENKIWFRLRIPSHRIIAVIEQSVDDPLARWIVKTVYSEQGDNKVEGSPEETVKS